MKKIINFGVLYILMLIAPIIVFARDVEQRYVNDFDIQIDNYYLNSRRFYDMVNPMILSGTKANFGEKFLVANSDSKLFNDTGKVLSYLNLFDSVGNKEKGISIEDYFVFEIMPHGNYFYVINIDSSYTEVKIIKYDTNLNKLSEITETIVPDIISYVLAMKFFGIDLMREYNDSLVVFNTDGFIFLDFDLSLIDFVSYDSASTICDDVFSDLCYFVDNNVYLDSGIIDLYFKNGDYEFFSNALDYSSEVELYKDGKLVFQNDLSSFEIVSHPIVLDDELFALGVKNDFSYLLCFDFEGNVTIIDTFNLAWNLEIKGSDLSTTVVDYDYETGSYVAGMRHYSLEKVVDATDFSYDKFGPYDMSNPGKVFNNIIKLSDDSYVAVGNLIVKFDQNGEVLFEKDLDYNIKSVLATSDGGFIGVSNSSIIKFNMDGDDIWEKNIDFLINYLISVSDGGYVGVGGKSGDAVIVKYDKDFNILWQDVDIGEWSDTFYNVIETKDGNYAVVGSVQTSSDWPYDPNGVLLIYDKQGNYSEVFSGADSFLDVIEDSDGDFVIIGMNNDIISSGEGSDSNAVILKVDKKGNKKWQRTFSSSYSYFSDITETIDGNYVAVGDIFDNQLLIKIDKTGNILFMIDGKEAGLEYDYSTMNCVIEVSQDEFFVVGHSSYNVYGSGTLFKIKYEPTYIVKDSMNGKYEVDYLDGVGKIALKPDDGYELDELSIVDLHGNEVEYYQKDGAYYFDSDCDARISVTFKKAIINPNTTDFMKIGFVVILLLVLKNLFNFKKMKLFIGKYVV